MADSRLIIDQRDAGEVTILRLNGEIELDDGDLALRQCIHDLVDRGRTKVVLDLAGVTHMDSSGVGMIVGKLKTLRERGGDLKLLNLQTRGQRLFGTMKLLMVFEMFESEEAAVRSYEAHL
jgi:anti-sigma B factor antagonist